MSETAQRFSQKKPVLSARRVIGEYFEAIEAGWADYYEPDYFFEEDDEYGRSEHSLNYLFLDLGYDELLDQERQQRYQADQEYWASVDDERFYRDMDAYDRRLEHAHADRYEY